LAGWTLLAGASGALPAEAAGLAPSRLSDAWPAAAFAPNGDERVGCPETLAAQLASTGQARQLVTVEASRPAARLAAVEIWQRARGCWNAAGGPWAALIGRNGFSDHHREGAGTTPTGIYAIGPEMYGTAPNPGTRYPYHRLVCGDWWDEDPTSARYNTFQHVACGQSPAFGGASEALWTETSAYPSFAVVEYNTRPVIAYAGSAIFVHAEFGEPTSGCVALPLPQLDVLLRWLVPGLRPAIVMGPAGEIARF